MHCEGKSFFFFFLLPKDEAVKNQWLKFIFTAIPQQYSPNLVLCPCHFNEDCYSQCWASYSKNVIYYSLLVTTFKSNIVTLLITFWQQ